MDHTAYKLWLSEGLDSIFDFKINKCFSIQNLGVGGGGYNDNCI